MSLEEITTAPTLEDFTLLSAHEEQTPGTFFGGKPVLHLHCLRAQLRTAKSEPVDDDAPAIAKWLQSGTQQNESSTADGGAQNGHDEDSNVREVDVWVTSRNLILFSPISNTGARISYSTITFHAQEGRAVLLGLNISDPHTTPDEDIIFFHARLVPGDRVETHAQQSQQQDDGQSEESTAAAPVNGEADPARKLFDAIAACQELNPDPPQAGGDDGDDEDGEEQGFDETAPGATGWITSENMADFMDEEGNFRMPQGLPVIGGEDDGEVGFVNGLGDGAGTRRTAAEMDGHGDEGGDGDETKWQRTED